MLFFRGYSSAGRALAWHARGQRFDPAYLHQVSSNSAQAGKRLSSSSRGLGHDPFTVGTGVRIPVRTPPFIFKAAGWAALLFLRFVFSSYLCQARNRFFSLRDSPWFVIRVTRRSFLHPIFPSAPIFDNINGLNFRQIFGILGVPFNRYY